MRHQRGYQASAYQFGFATSPNHRIPKLEAHKKLNVGLYLGSKLGHWWQGFNLAENAYGDKDRFIRTHAWSNVQKTYYARHSWEHIRLRFCLDMLFFVQRRQSAQNASEVFACWVWQRIWRQHSMGRHTRLNFTPIRPNSNHCSQPSIVVWWRLPPMYQHNEMNSSLNNDD